MSEAPIIAATYVEWKMIKTRKVLQLVFELPLEQQQDVLMKLGAPRPDRDDWYGIVALKKPREPMQVLDPTTPDGEPFSEDEEPREPPVPLQEGSRPPDSVAFAPQANSGPGGAIHDDCPHDWYRDRCQICGARADTAAELGSTNHQKDAPLSGAERRRYAAFLRSVREHPRNPNFRAWVSCKTREFTDEARAGEYIKWRCGIDTRLSIKTDEIACEKFLEMEAEFNAETPGRLAEQRG